MSGSDCLRWDKALETPLKSASSLSESGRSAFDVLDALRKRADDDDRSVSWSVNSAIRVALKLDQPKRKVPQLSSKECDPLKEQRPMLGTHRLPI